MPKTSSRRAKKARTPKPQSREPEVLGDDTHDGVREPLLDALSYVLEKSDGYQAPARKAIVAAFGGTCDAAREHEVLLMVKRDARFRVIADSGRHGNRIALVDVGGDAGQPTPERIAPVDATGVAKDIDDAARAVLEEVAKAVDTGQQTLGEMVEAQKGKPQRIAWPHDVGSSVLLLTDGYPPAKAIIRNIHNHGSYALYDLATATGGETNGVPADRIGRDLDAEGELESMRLRMSALERHIARGATLAQRIVVKQAEERTQAEALSKLRKEIEALYGELADHERSEPGQTDLRDVVGDGKEPRGERMASEPSADEDVLADGPAEAAAEAEARARLDALDLDELGVSFDDLMASRLEQGTWSTGKPQVVHPVTPVDREEGSYGNQVLADVQDGVAVLVPVLTKREWTGRMAETYGPPVKLPSDDRPAKLAAGGRWCGIPVKVGRATCYLGADAAALLVRLPEPEERPTGKEAAAGA